MTFCSKISVICNRFFFFCFSFLCMYVWMYLCVSLSLSRSPFLLEQNNNNFCLYVIISVLYARAINEKKTVYTSDKKAARFFRGCEREWWRNWKTKVSRLSLGIAFRVCLYFLLLMFIETKTRRENCEFSYHVCLCLTLLFQIKSFSCLHSSYWAHLLQLTFITVCRFDLSMCI